MKKHYLISLFLLLLPVSAFCQQNEGLARILTTVLENDLIQPYLPHDSSNQLNIQYLIAGRNVPTRMTVLVQGEVIPVKPDTERLSGNLLRVVKLIWKDHRAKVVLRGPGNFFARYKLYLDEDEWAVANAYLKGIAYRNGKKNRSWDFKF